MDVTPLFLLIFSEEQMLSYLGFRRHHLSCTVFPKAETEINRFFMSLFKFLVKRRGKTTTRVIKLPLRLLSNPTKSLSDMNECVGGELSCAGHL